MFLNSLSELPKLLKNVHFLILITEVDIPKTWASFSFTPNDKNTHDIETVRKIETLVRTKQTSPRTIALQNADRLTIPAQNAFLKLLEEPNHNISFLFVAPSSSAFLPTIISRAKLFYLRTTAPASPPDKTTLAQARILVSGRQADLIPLATTLAKNREQAQLVTRTAISELHQSQLKKPSPQFLARLEKLLALEKALTMNGHVKLHIVNMVA